MEQLVTDYEQDKNVVAKTDKIELIQRNLLDFQNDLTSSVDDIPAHEQQKYRNVIAPETTVSSVLLYIYILINKNHLLSLYQETKV